MILGLWLSPAPSANVWRVVAKHLLTPLADYLDPLQFAYKMGRGTDDVTLSLMNTITKHLQQPKSYVRLLFIGFTSAFNCMRKQILIKRLCDLNVNGNLILWIKDFLTDRPQKVFFNGNSSDQITLNTGAPQGCVLSPTLFSIYTNEKQMINSVCQLYKYADDMALI
ncbi:hypothetical protein LDENG_00122430 [Lucifuga dentata]|nr:hypothetical protein LDENG_00122430 [Lucifuga dentata]